MRRKAIIVGLSGIKISKDEKKLLKKFKPWGVILFERNLKNFNQIKNLINNIKKIMNDKKYPILIDEEGGKVARLKKLINIEKYSQEYFGKKFKKNKKKGIQIYKDYLNDLCVVLKKTGININTIPVLDLLQKVTAKIIKGRVYSDNVSDIQYLGNLCIQTMKKNKIAGVIKHIPGHGCASLDSHIYLPKVRKKLKKLLNEDFKCFEKNNSLFAMTAHVVYEKLDVLPATLSSFIIKNIIRKKLKFKGILITDDICMKSLKFDLLTNSLLALKSGCNLVLHCSGKISEMRILLEKLPHIDNFTKNKTYQFYKFLT